MEENKSPVACFSMTPSPCFSTAVASSLPYGDFPVSHNIQNLATFPTLLLPNWLDLTRSESRVTVRWPIWEVKSCRNRKQEGMLKRELWSEMEPMGQLRAWMAARLGSASKDRNSTSPNLE